MFLHISILNLFRPFYHGDRRNIHLTIFSSPHATPAAAYQASLNQLKRLVHIFWHGFACASYAILWHPALLQVANGTVREPGSAAAFQACLAGYIDLARGFAVAKSIVKALLAMAVRAGVMDRSDVLQMATSIALKGPPHESSREDGPDTIVVDLYLALSNVMEGRIGAMAHAFDMLSKEKEFDSEMDLDQTP